MRIVVQRVIESSVVISDVVVAHVNRGILALIGFTHDDNETIVDYMLDKLLNLRIFEDEMGKMNLSVLQVKGSLLSVPQFTLYADARSGRRPSFTQAALPAIASKLYDYFNQQCGEKGINIDKGVFGADMKVQLVNDGPVTILLDSEQFLKK